MNGFGGNKKMLWSRRINRRMGCLLADVCTVGVKKCTPRHLMTSKI